MSGVPGIVISAPMLVLQTDGILNSSSTSEKPPGKPAFGVLMNTFAALAGVLFNQ
jgi:hypothetical protein